MKKQIQTGTSLIKLLFIPAIMLFLLGCKSEENMISYSNTTPNLQVPPPPDSLPYEEYEFWYQNQILKINSLPQKREPLEKWLAGPAQEASPILIEAAIFTLGEYGNPGSVEVIRPYVSHLHENIGVTAQYSLIKIKPSEFSDTLLIPFLNADLEAYLSGPMAAGFLARLGNHDGFEKISQCLTSPYRKSIQMIACKQVALFFPFVLSGEIEEKDFNALVESALQNPDPDIQWQILVQLSQLSLSESTQVPLKTFIKTCDDEQLKALAKEALHNQ